MQLDECRDCPLWQNLDPTIRYGKRLKHLTVPGRGPQPAKYMVVGEAPGVEEADQGLELVGRSGRSFDVLMRLWGVSREDCFVTNLVKHRPPKNRTPKMAERRACAKYLDMQLEAVRPKVIITLGAVASSWFRKETVLAIDHGKARAIKYQGRQYTLVPMYHPAYALRNPDIWAVLVEDFMRLSEELQEAPAHSPPLELPDYSLATDSEAAQLGLASDVLGFDLETTSPKRGRYFMVQEAEIVGYSLAWEDGLAVYVPEKPRHVRAALESPLVEKICHHTKFELGKLKQLGISLTNFQDTKIAAWMLQYHSNHLKALARQMLGRDPITYEQVTQGVDMSELDPKDVVDYAAADADNTRMIWPRLRRELQKEKLWDLYEQVELPLIPVLHDMEARGVLVDEGWAQVVLEELKREIISAEGMVTKLGLPAEFDVDSFDQLADGLEKLGAPITKRTDVKQQLATDEATLEDVKAKGWMPDLMDAILRFRSLRKLRSYADQYLTLRGPDGRLHPDWVQAGSEEDRGNTKEDDRGPRTGRLACRGPNLTNQPHHKLGYEYWAKRLRQCIIPTPSWVLVSADIGQEEPRIMAFVTQDQQLLQDFAEGVSPYAMVGEIIYERPITKVDESEWYCAKTFFLAKGYGADWHKIREIDPSVPLARAKRANHLIDQRYPRLARHFERVKEHLQEHGWVRDWFGRRRVIPKVFHQDRHMREEGYREGANFLIQAPAASVLKRAMRRIWDALRPRGVEAHLLMSIHDELVLECPPHEVPQLTHILRHMTDGIMPVQFPVEIKTGASWGEMTPYG